MEDIAFHGSENALRDFPRPYPASRAVPDWLKDMSMVVGDAPTVKRCAPFLQGVTAGYILPLAADCHFSCDAAGTLSVRADYRVVEAHSPDQYAGTPFANMAVVKFLNPWLVRTPPGYSTLFCPPINRFGMPFAMLTGIVETDTFYCEIHFPGISTLRPNTNFTLRQGTPLMQAIPIKRDTWQSGFDRADESRVAAMQEAIKANPHLYKENYWVKQGYT